MQEKVIDVFCRVASAFVFITISNTTIKITRHNNFTFFFFIECKEVFNEEEKLKLNSQTIPSIQNRISVEPH